MKNNLKPIGLTRQIDNVLRITIPVEYRKTAGFMDCSVFYEYVDENTIMITKISENINLKYRIDGLGRFRVPVKLSKKLNWNIGDKIEIQLWDNHSLSIKKM